MMTKCSKDFQMVYYWDQPPTNSENFTGIWKCEVDKLYMSMCVYCVYITMLCIYNYAELITQYKHVLGNKEYNIT